MPYGRRYRVYGYPCSCGCMHVPWMPWTYPGFRAPTKEEEINALHEEAAALEEELKEIRKRIQELGE